MQKVRGNSLKYNRSILRSIENYRKNPRNNQLNINERKSNIIMVRSKRYFIL